MPSIAPKKLLPGIVLLVIVVLYIIYSSTTSEVESLEVVTADTSAESSFEAREDIANQEENKTDSTSVDESARDETVKIEKAEASRQLAVTEQSANTHATKVTQSTDQQLTAEKEKILFVEGKKNDFITKFPAEEPKEPALVEFFSYWCPHCYNAEPTLKIWRDQKPDTVKFIKIPVVFGRDSWRLAAKSYYIAEELNMTDNFSQLMFKTIHELKNPPQTEADIGKIFEQLGISSKIFTETAASFNVDAKLRKAEYLAKKFEVAHVPYFLINFKYEAAEASFETQKSLFRLWSYLPAKDFE